MGYAMLSDDEKEMYLMLLPNWESGIAREADSADTDFYKHYVPGKRYYKRIGDYGWWLPVDLAFEKAINDIK